MNSSIFIAFPDKNELNDMLKGFKNHGYNTFGTHEESEICTIIKSNPAPVTMILSATFKSENIVKICQNIRTIGKVSRVPIFILYEGEINKNDYINLGIKGFFKLPVYTTTLREHIKEIQLKAGSPGQLIDPNKAKQKIIILTIFSIIFIAFLSYFILIPMFWKN